MIGSAAKTAASSVAVPEVTTEKSDMDKNSLDREKNFLDMTLGIVQIIVFVFPV